MVAQTDDGEFTLRGPQCGVYYDNRPYIYYKGGRGVGKTVSAVSRIKGMIDRGELQPGSRILCMGPTYPQLKDGTLVSFDELMGDNGFGYIVSKVDGNEPHRILVNGIKIYFRNASNPDQTRGHAVQVIWLDEAAQMRKDILQMLAPCLRNHGDDAIYQTICTSTPRGKNWLYNAFVNPKTRMDEEQLGYYHISTVEAERIGIARPGYVASMNISEGSAWWRQEILGEEVAFTGNVFHYEPERDSPIPFILPDKFKTVVGGIDIGTTAPTAVVLIGIDLAGRYWVFREFYQRRADFHNVLDLIGEWDKEFHVRFWAIDSAANLEAKMMRSVGYSVRNSLKAKDAAGTAVNFINSLMERGMFRISPDCVAGIMELQNYEHKEMQSGDEVTFLDKVKPDQPDHFIDALRYAIAPLSSAAATRGYGGAVQFAISR